MCAQDYLIIKYTLVYLNAHITLLKCNNINIDNNEAGVLQFDITDQFPTITSIPLNNHLITKNDTFLMYGL